MILKIKDYNGDWWIYSELEKIHHWIMKKDSDIWKTQVENTKKMCSLDLTLDGKLSDKFLRLTTRTRDDKEFSIILEDCICFLCNEEGKTIDKIVC